jgi:hypothetical protein
METTGGGVLSQGRLSTFMRGGLLSAVCQPVANNETWGFKLAAASGTASPCPLASGTRQLQHFIGVLIGESRAASSPWIAE